MTLLDVLIRNEWLRVTVTREPDATCTSWAGTTEDGKLVAWDERDETRAVAFDGTQLPDAAPVPVLGLQPVAPERACFDCGAADPSTTLFVCDTCRVALAAPVACSRCGEYRDEETYLHHTLICGGCHGEMSDDALAALTNRTAQLKTEWALEITRLRDALAVQQHRSELERDVIEAAKAWRASTLANAEDMGEALVKAVDVLVGAERAK